MLFDVRVGTFWFTREAVREKAEQLEVPMPPDLGIMTEAEIMDFVLSRSQSRCSLLPQPIEGIIARTEPLMLFRNNKPVMWKLKVRDFS